MATNHPPTLPPVFSALQPSPSASAGKLSLPSSLTNWRPGEQLPRGTSRAELVTARETYRRALKPGGVEAFAPAMDRLLEFAGTFGVPDDKARSALGFYRDALAALPADLMALAVQRTVSGWTRFARLPLPAELTATVAEEFAKRKIEAGRLDLALRHCREEPAREPMSEEQRERNLDLLRQAREHLERGADS